MGMRTPMGGGGPGGFEQCILQSDGRFLWRRLVVSRNASSFGYIQNARRRNQGTPLLESAAKDVSHCSCPPHAHVISC